MHPPCQRRFPCSSFGRLGYRIRIPYVDATGAKRIYHQTFSTRKLGLTLEQIKIQPRFSLFVSRLERLEKRLRALSLRAIGWSVLVGFVQLWRRRYF